VARLSKLRGSDEEARFSMLIRDKYQRHGLGSELLSRIIQIGKDEKLKRIIALMSPENSAMRDLCKKFRFIPNPDPQTRLIRAELDLQPS